MTTYMTHEKYGVHIAYTDAEIELNKRNGWVVYGPTPPMFRAGKLVDVTPTELKRDSIVTPLEVAEVTATTITAAPKKRGRPRKVA